MRGERIPLDRRTDLELDEARARMVTALVIEHKGRCDDEECPIVLSLLARVVEDLRGHVLTPEERRLFL